MPKCFSLTPKGQDKPEQLITVDEKMCKHFNVPCDKHKYHAQ
jgi:hypothetical protein